MTEQERAEALARQLVHELPPMRIGAEQAQLLARALLDADQRITDLTQERDELLGLGGMQQTYEATLRADAAEAQLAACRDALAALRLTVARQLTPLDVAITHIDILRRKSEDYAPSERDNVAIVVEKHANEARSELFRALSDGGSET